MKGKEILIPAALIAPLTLPESVAADGRGSAEAIRHAIEEALGTVDTDCRAAASQDGTRFEYSRESFGVMPKEDYDTPMSAPGYCGCETSQQGNSKHFSCSAD